jgi:hypothetical protein
MAKPRAVAVKDGTATLQMMLARQGVALVRMRWK